MQRLFFMASLHCFVNRKPPACVPVPSPKRLPLRHLSEFQKCFGCNATKEKLWLCLKGGIHLGWPAVMPLMCVSSSGLFQSTAGCWWGCFNIFCFASFFFFSLAVNVFLHCSSALTFFNHLLTQNFEGNLKGDSDVQKHLVVYQGKVAKWLSGLTLSRTDLKRCSHPSDLTQISSPNAVPLCSGIHGVHFKTVTPSGKITWKHIFILKSPKIFLSGFIWRHVWLSR